MVLTDNYYPGWQVTVDGHPAKIERVDYLLRGVVIGPGIAHDRLQLPAGELDDRVDHQPRDRAGAAGRGRERARRAKAARDGGGVSDPGGYAPQPLGKRARRLAREQGAVPVARRLGRWGAEALFGLPWTVAGSRGEFELGGTRYPYLFDRYKHTWLTERAVEVPVIGALVDSHGDGRVLEVGHVLGHYRDGHHLVVDKYERAPGVLNRDALELARPRPVRSDRRDLDARARRLGRAAA